MKIGDLVMIADNSPRHSWIIGRIIEVVKNNVDVVRVVKVKTQALES